MNTAFANVIGSVTDILYRIPAVILAFTIHEFMHAYVAVKAGDNTPINQGRYTLNPLKHIDPIGFIMVLLVGIGWAKPVQININNFENKRKSYMMVSLAGVIGNLMLAFVVYALIFFSPQVFAANTIVYNILSYTVRLNLMLIWLNILPVPPLDGFNVFTTLIRFRNMNIIYTLKRYGFIILIALMFLGILGRYISFMSGLTLAGFTALFDLIQRLTGLV